MDKVIERHSQCHGERLHGEDAGGVSRVTFDADDGARGDPGAFREFSLRDAGCFARWSESDDHASSVLTFTSSVKNVTRRVGTLAATVTYKSPYGGMLDIKETLATHGTTVYAVARKAAKLDGSTPDSWERKIYRWIGGQEAKLNSAATFASALGITLDDLAGRVSSEEDAAANLQLMESNDEEHPPPAPTDADQPAKKGRGGRTK